MDELADSGGLASDPAALRARLAADGYVFLRGLLPPERVRAAGELVAAKLRAGGWTAAGSPGPDRAGPREALADPAYRAAVMSLAFNALPYLAPLRGTVRRILGAQTFSYPVKVLSAVGPEVPAERPRSRYIHCDYMGSGVQDMLTTWIPLASDPSCSADCWAASPGGSQSPRTWSSGRALSWPLSPRAHHGSSQPTPPGNAGNPCPGQFINRSGIDRGRSAVQIVR